MGRRPQGDRCKWRQISDYEGRARWEVELWLDGERTRKTCYSEEEARRTAAILKAQIRNGTLLRPRTWDEAEEMFRAERIEDGTRETSFDSTYPARFKAVRKTTGVDDPLLLSTEHGRAHKAARLAQERSPATINGELDAITTLQAFFVKQGWLKRQTWLDIKRLEAEPCDIVLLPDEVGPFLRSASKLSLDPPGEARKSDWWWWEAAAWAFCFGVRSNEANQLEPRDFDFRHGLIKIGLRPGFVVKSKKSRRIIPYAFSAEAVSVFRRAFEGRDPESPCFPSRRDGRGHFARGGHHFRMRCHETCKDAGVTDVHPHALRHSLATVVAMDGGDIGSLAELLGHDQKVTRGTYTHTSIGRQLAAARAAGGILDRAVAGKPVLTVLDGGLAGAEISAEKAPKTGKAG